MTSGEHVKDSGLHSLQLSKTPGRFSHVKTIQTFFAMPGNDREGLFKKFPERFFVVGNADRRGRTSAKKLVEDLNFKTRLVTTCGQLLWKYHAPRNCSLIEQKMNCRYQLQQPMPSSFKVSLRTERSTVPDWGCMVAGATLLHPFWPETRRQ
ncbi:hypothetical protein TNCT_615281 [Trichonephila clavata]|uniref:Uncharacterized protein n=1 Tax=Trichonephila clavata TaxID=2740835 RepID=A0A8X6HCA1_TRICU|nr:hypothetical protein TNCT_615281 [Trichonephila clavata]